MDRTERKPNALGETFSLTVDDYGRLWLHAKIEGVPVLIDLAEKNIAFEIMAAKMDEYGFDHHSVQKHEPSDNDDEEAP